MRTVFRILITLLLPATVSGVQADDESSRAKDLLPPVRIAAGGEPVLAQGRCAAVAMGDIDGDHKPDLLVGQMSEGRLSIYHNIGTADQPQFGKAVDFTASGQMACVPTGCYTAFNPQLIDFDGDGRIDILTPSFHSGIYLFRRVEGESFAEGVMLEDRDDRPFEFRYNGAALAYDWDADGDLDLLVRGGLPEAGSGVNVIINHGNRQTASFGKPRSLSENGVRIAGKPCAMVDWDGDGRDDLLTCAGSVQWHRNTGETGSPQLQPAVVLVPSGDYRQIERSHDQPLSLPDSPGRIDSVCVADFNGDGRFDLLGASTWCDRVAMPELTEEQQAVVADLRSQIESVSERCQALRKAPPKESRAARLRRQSDYLNTWRELARLRAAWGKYNSRHDYGCIWLFARTGS